MFTSRRLSILGLAVCLTAAAATAAASTTHAAPASAAPQISVVGHVTTYLAIRERNVVRSKLGHRLTLYITGSNFGPGNVVRIAIVNTVHWTVVAKATTHAQPEIKIQGCARGHEGCSGANPYSGTINYLMRLSSAPAAANLLVLYRSAGDPGIQTVTLR